LKGFSSGICILLVACYDWLLTLSVYTSWWHVGEERTMLGGGECPASRFWLLDLRGKRPLLLLNKRLFGPHG